MNNTTQELTSSLQEITARYGNNGGCEGEPLPTAVCEGQVQIPQEIDAFLDASQEYSARTRSVNVGKY